MDFEPSDKTEEWFLIIGDWYRETSKVWFYALLVTIIGVIPLYYTVKFILVQTLVSTNVPIRVNYQEIPKLPLEIVENKVFTLDNGTYSGYVRIRNSNSDWGVSAQPYTVEFVGSNGSSVLNTTGSTFVLPGSEKIVVLPRFSSTTAPVRINFTLGESQFTRPPSLPALELEVQRREMAMQGAQSVANAVIVNRTPFTISRVDLPVLLFDNAGQVVGANYTNINDLKSAESRSFQYVWYSRINNVARIEIIPEINIYNRDIFLSAPSQNPF